MPSPIVLYEDNDQEDLVQLKRGVLYKTYHLMKNFTSPVKVKPPEHLPSDAQLFEITSKVDGLIYLIKPFNSLDPNKSGTLQIIGNPRKDTK